jgi:hypothetical protein
VRVHLLAGMARLQADGPAQHIVQREDHALAELLRLEVGEVAGATVDDVVGREPAEAIRRREGQRYLSRRQVGMRLTARQQVRGRVGQNGVEPHSPTLPGPGRIRA